MSMWSHLSPGQIEICKLFILDIQVVLGVGIPLLSCILIQLTCTVCECRFLMDMKSGHAFIWWVPEFAFWKRLDRDVFFKSSWEVLPHAAMFYDMFVCVYVFVYVSFLTNTYHDIVTDPIGYKKESLLLLYVGIQWNVMMITPPNRTWKWWFGRWFIFLFQGCILRFHVNLPVCIFVLLEIVGGSTTLFPRWWS